MNRSLLLGVWRYLLRVPRPLWQNQVAQNARKATIGLGNLSFEAGRVRSYAVAELPRSGRQLSPEQIASGIGLPLERVISILDELERGMTFLYRDPQGCVTWAYPVTVDRTPHRVTFTSGEQLYAAWAVDAIATPFVQGQLRKEPLSIHIETECGHCGEKIDLEIDSQLHYRVLQPGADPLIFAPMVDFQKLKDPSIIDAFWRKSIFFWSEEHAIDFRRKQAGVRGTYLTLPQAVYVTPILQGALFGFQR